MIRDEATCGANTERRLFLGSTTLSTPTKRLDSVAYDRTCVKGHRKYWRYSVADLAQKSPDPSPTSPTTLNRRREAPQGCHIRQNKVKWCYNPQHFALGKLALPNGSPAPGTVAERLPAESYPLAHTTAWNGTRDGNMNYLLCLPVEGMYIYIYIYMP